jgi:hypothetical protein
MTHGTPDGVAAGGEEELDEPRCHKAPRAGHAHGGAPLRRLHAALASFSLLGSAQRFFHSGCVRRSERAVWWVLIFFLFLYLFNSELTKLFFT